MFNTGITVFDQQFGTVMSAVEREAGVSQLRVSTFIVQGVQIDGSA